MPQALTNLVLCLTCNRNGIEFLTQLAETKLRFQRKGTFNHQRFLDFVADRLAIFAKQQFADPSDHEARDQFGVWHRYYTPQVRMDAAEQVMYKIDAILYDKKFPLIQAINQSEACKKGFDPSDSIDLKAVNDQHISWIVKDTDGLGLFTVAFDKIDPFDLEVVVLEKIAKFVKNV